MLCLSSRIPQKDMFMSSNNPEKINITENSSISTPRTALEKRMNEDTQKIKDAMEKEVASWVTSPVFLYQVKC